MIRTTYKGPSDPAPAVPEDVAEAVRRTDDAIRRGLDPVAWLPIEIAWGPFRDNGPLGWAVDVTLTRRPDDPADPPVVYPAQVSAADLGDPDRRERAAGRIANRFAGYLMDGSFRRFHRAVEHIRALSANGG